MGMNEYLSLFIDESREHLQAMNDNMLNLENSPDDISIVQHIFRSAHTLKGMAATMGFEDLASLTHEMENVLDLIRNNQLRMNEKIFDILFQSLDLLEAMVNDIIGGGTGALDVSEVVSKLKTIDASEADDQPAGKIGELSDKLKLDQFQYSILQQTLNTDHHAYYIEVMIEQSCVLKAARAYMVFEALEQTGEIIKSFPSVEEIEQDQFDRGFSVYFVSRLKQTDVEERIKRISEIESVVILDLDESALEELVENQATSREEQATEKTAASEVAATVEARTAQSKPQAGGKREVQAATRTIRVDIERLDALMNLFSELLIDRVRLESLAEEIKRPDLTETVEHMARVSSDLQNIVLKVRMVPVESVFNRFPRMIRDLARNLNKKVELVITGADTELDRTVIDEIGDPLVHLLRNALDHGVEAPEDRVKAGKPETGTIHLRAYHSGNNVFIEIEEDGRGIHRDKVLQTALKNGVVTPEKAEGLSDDEVFQLLFASGFSTAEQISDISGRGVGLDVVKSKINALGGQVRVESEFGKGTKFSVQLPLTLSIIVAMLIRMGTEKYAIPLSSIVETAILPKNEISHVHGMSMMNYRDHVIPLVYLRKVLDCPGEEQDDLKEHNVVIVRKGDKHAAIIVDELLGQQEIVLKSLGQYLKQIFAISGATILGDGQVALIIDPNALVK